MANLAVEAILESNGRINQIIEMQKKQINNLQNTMVALQAEIKLIKKRISDLEQLNSNIECSKINFYNNIEIKEALRTGEIR